MTTTAPVQAPTLEEALTSSTKTWQTDLQSLFSNTKERFGDVVWELQEEGKEEDVEEIYGHKAIVYARAPPSFQARYFSFRPAPAASPLPFAPSPSPLPLPPVHSALSLDYLPSASRSPSPMPMSLPPSSPGAPLRIPTSINPILFSNELEYLYTGAGLGDAFDFLFDSTESKPEGDPVDKLRKDLVFMWRSRLYCDVRLALTGTFSSANHESTTAIFSAHRFVLVSRSPYFRDLLLSWSKPPPTQSSEPQTLTLPSPPFTPAALHFALGFIYTGTLAFSHRTFDLETALALHRAGTYLVLPTLETEICARISQEMCHGLFHAPLDFAAYERLTGGRWGAGGCRCRQCARRAPRVLAFALSPDVHAPVLERGARRAMVGLFGEGWCTLEFVTLEPKTRETIIRGVGKRSTPTNALALLLAAKRAQEKLANSVDAWADVTRDCVERVRRGVDAVVCERAEEVFEGREWLDVMEGDGARFEDAELVETLMDSVKRGLSESTAATVYQVLVSTILLRPHPSDPSGTMLSPTSHVRVAVEETRVEVARWIRRRWIGVRAEGGFDNLEGWAVKEISGEIDIPVEELLSPDASRHPPKQRAATGDQTDTDTMSLASARVTRPSNASRVAPSIRSTTSSIVNNTWTGNGRRTPVTSSARPDSKLTPVPSSAASSVRSTLVGEGSSRRVTSPVAGRVTSPTNTGRSGVVSPLGHRASARSLASTASRPRSSAPSVRSVSTATTAGPSNANRLRPPPAHTRPASSLSTTSASTAEFASAASDLPGARSRRMSTASTASRASVRTNGTAKDVGGPGKTTPATGARPRKMSAASTASTAAAARATKSPAATTSPLPGSSKVIRKTPSSTSVKSTAASVKSAAPSVKSTTPSTKSTTPSTKAGTTTGTRTVRKVSSSTSIKSTTSTAGGIAANARKAAAEKNVPPLPTKTQGQTNGVSKPTASMIKTDSKGKGKTMDSAATHVSSPSSGSTLTVKGLKRKGSADTITKSTLGTVAPGKAPPPDTTPLKEGITFSPRGATLDIGIPCIISSKRKRFRAFARYIGEVEGEAGPWVGVEVPMGDTWPGEKLGGRAWHDGTWGGVRYFDIGMSGSDWGDGGDYKRRRMATDATVASRKGVKREGESLGVDRPKRIRSASPTVSDVSMNESRGLFVRPQQVLYVVDAVGSDL